MVVGVATVGVVIEAARTIPSDTRADEWDGAIDEGTDGTEGRWKLDRVLLALGCCWCCCCSSASIESKEVVMVAVVVIGLFSSHTLPQMPPPRIPAVVGVILACANIKFNRVGVVRSPH